MARGRDPGLDTGQPNLQRGPTEQRTLDTDQPFSGGGRRADLPADYQQREAADADCKINLARNTRQDKEALGQKPDTTWVRGGSGRKLGI
jgi:hypothetical protein